jgi:hypothetical protein
LKPLVFVEVGRIRAGWKGTDERVPLRNSRFDFTSAAMLADRSSNRAIKPLEEHVVAQIDARDNGRVTSEQLFAFVRVVRSKNHQIPSGQGLCCGHV